MIRVRLHAPRGIRPGDPAEGFTRDVELAGAPHVGDGIDLLWPEPDGSGDECRAPFRVHGVHWQPGDPDCDVYVVLR